VIQHWRFVDVRKIESAFNRIRRRGVGVARAEARVSEAGGPVAEPEARQTQAIARRRDSQFRRFCYLPITRAKVLVGLSSFAICHHPDLCNVIP